MAWYENFFDDWYLKYWVQPITHERTCAEVTAAERFCELKPHDHVLDLCCGQGRHSVELARRGYRVTGYDLSETLLAAAEKEAHDAGVDVEFVRGDMREVPWQDRFDAVVNFYTAFGYFEHDHENQAVLDRVAGALKPGGRFLLDYPCLEGRMANWKTQEFFRYDDGTVMCHDIILNVFDQTIVNKALYITADGQRHKTGFTLRHYYGRELRKCFDTAGMDVIGTYGSLDGAPLKHTDTRVLVIGRKRPV